MQKKFTFYEAGAEKNLPGLSPGGDLKKIGHIEDQFGDERRLKRQKVKFDFFYKFEYNE